MTYLPNFSELASACLELLQRTVGEDDLALYDAHALRQAAVGTAGGSLFNEHRDNHDDPSRSQLRYSMAIKLTADPPGANQSSMVVLERPELPPLYYDRAAGGGVIFRSQDRHSSQHQHRSLGTVYKIVFFFRRARDTEAEFHDHINRPYFDFKKYTTTKTYVENRLGLGAQMPQEVGVATLRDVWSAAPPPPAAEEHERVTRGATSATDLVWSNPRGCSCCLKPDLSEEIVTAAEECTPKSIFPRGPDSTAEQLVEQMGACQVLDNMTWTMTGGQPRLVNATTFPQPRRKS